MRTVVEDPGGPTGVWPPLSTGAFTVKPGLPFFMEFMTDPNLNAILVGGPGGGILHYLAGTGPAVVHWTADQPVTDGSPVSVTDANGPPPSMALCRRLVKSSSGG